MWQSKTEKNLNKHLNWWRTVWRASSGLRQHAQHPDFPWFCDSEVSGKDGEQQKDVVKILPLGEQFQRMKRTALTERCTVAAVGQIKPPLCQNQGRDFTVGLIFF